jgi:uncharacterized protein (DUF433 family)
MRSTQPSEVVLTGPNGQALIRNTSDVRGRDACIRETRSMVWPLVALMRDGGSDQELLANYAALYQQDLDAARSYHAQHRPEIDEATAENERVDEGLGVSWMRMKTFRSL